MNNLIIETKNLTKQYGAQKSVSNLNIHVQKGRIYGLLGRNGAGKTTTMKMLLGLTKPTTGEIKIFGQDIHNNEKKLLPRIGCLIESPGFYPNLTGTENLKIFARLRGIPKKNAVESALEVVGLPNNDKKLFSQYSLGMKQRLAIALAIMHDPQLLILDEPINGLDPMGIVEIRELLKKINKEKDMTILISSHILSELSELATTYGIISNGKLIEEITAEELVEKCRQYIELRVDDTSRAVTLLERELGISDYEVLEDKKIKVFSNLENVGEVNSILSKSGVIVESISVKGENLEEYFMNTVGGVLNA